MSRVYTVSKMGVIFIGTPCIDKIGILLDLLIHHNVASGHHIQTDIKRVFESVV